ncbi:MAG: hypothetical protein EBS42_13815 [Caulobacteraceae bacterium]|nr:hypothetical protein [Caulobacteraceae bacterium]
MPFPADRVGHVLTPSETPITIRRILSYAAGLGAAEPAFLDDAAAGGLRALPFQCVGPEWPVVLSLRDAVSDRLSPAEAQRGVHSVQDSHFHRPMVSGDDLVVTGQLMSARTVRSGVHLVFRLESHDRGTGDLVTTSWTSSIYRDVGLEGEDRVLAEPPRSAPWPAPSEDAEETRIVIPREMPHVYSECADIWNPIHTERAVALAAGLPDIILHGTATWALAGLTVLRRHADSDVGRLARITGRFSGMVIPGEEIVIRHQALPGGLVSFEVRSATGAPVISQGGAWLR